LTTTGIYNRHNIQQRSVRSIGLQCKKSIGTSVNVWR